MHVCIMRVMHVTWTLSVCCVRWCVCAIQIVGGGRGDVVSLAQRRVGVERGVVAVAPGHRLDVGTRGPQLPSERVTVDFCRAGGALTLVVFCVAVA